MLPTGLGAFQNRMESDLDNRNESAYRNIRIHSECDIVLGLVQS